jgi:hypothetical protein
MTFCTRSQDAQLRETMPGCRGGALHAQLGRELPAPLPARTTAAWVRFEHEREPYGVFSYLDEVLPGARDEVDRLCVWFSEHLDAPDVSHIERFWFKAEAAAYVERARRLAELLRAAGVPIVERRTTRVPGKVRAEDAQQVAVVTYRDAPRPGRKAPRSGPRRRTE